MPHHGFPKALRLLSPHDFERVFAARLSAGDSSIVLYGLANDLPYPRLGLTVSRKSGSAVVRNRWKRLLREAFRLKQHDLPQFDFICIPRAAAPPPLAYLLENLPALALTIHRKHEQRTRRDKQNSDPSVESNRIDRPA
jgi:ribonuclease P protein component